MAIPVRRLLSFAVIGLLSWPAGAAAQDLEAQIAAAEANAAEARADIAELESQVSGAEKRLRPVAAAAANANARAEESLRRAEGIEDAVVAERIDAAEEIAAANAKYGDERESHDEHVQVGIGVALAALAFIAIAVGWETFRAASPIRRLSHLSFWPAAGYAVGAGSMFLLVGAGLAALDGAGGVLGYALVVFGLGLPVAVLLARHSLRVQAETGQPLWTRERLPRAARLVVALLLLLLLVGSLATGPFSEDPAEPVFDDELELLAKKAEGDPAAPPSRQLRHALATAEPLAAQADKLEAAREQADDALNEAQAELAAARKRLNDAEHTARLASEKLAKQVAAAELAAERAARRAARQAAQAAAAPSSGAPPSYSSCDSAPDNVPVPPGSSLDADGDGIGCET